MDSVTHAVIIFIALVITAGFLVLVVALVPAIREMRELMASLRKTSDEVREVAIDAKRISSGAAEKIEYVSGIMSQAERIAKGMGTTLGTLKASSKYAEWLALIPAILLGWKAVRSIKRRRHEQRE